MTFSNFTICFEGIQRTYRNAIVRHLRTRLIIEFPADFSEKLRKPFKETEWKAIEQNAFAPRVSGQLEAPLNGEFDLLSVNHFFNLFECYYDISRQPQRTLRRSKRPTTRESCWNGFATSRNYAIQHLIRRKQI